MELKKMASVINEAPQEKAEIPLFRKLSYSLTDFGGMSYLLVLVLIYSISIRTCLVFQLGLLGPFCY